MTYNDSPNARDRILGAPITRRQLFGCLASLGLAATASGCKLRMTVREEEDPLTEGIDEVDLTGKTLSVAVMGEPNSLVLHEFCIPYLAEHGLSVNMKLYHDVDLATADIGSGRVECGYLHSKSQLNRINAEGPTGVSAVAAVTYEPFGAYSKRFDDIHTLPKGTRVALPQDLTRGGHALVMLAQEKVIGLDNPSALASKPENIIDNPQGLEFVQRPADTLVDDLDEYDVVMIPPDIAFPAGLSAADAIVIEANDNIAAQYYGQSLSSREPLINDARVQSLLTSMRSQECARYLQEHFGQNILQIVTLL
jgi:D-methionine transport system substrate-binding protein